MFKKRKTSSINILTNQVDVQFNQQGAHFMTQNLFYCIGSTIFTHEFHNNKTYTSDFVWYNWKFVIDYFLIKTFPEEKRVLINISERGNSLAEINSSMLLWVPLLDVFCWGVNYNIAIYVSDPYRCVRPNS